MKEEKRRAPYAQAVIARAAKIQQQIESNRSEAEVDGSGFQSAHQGQQRNSGQKPRRPSAMRPS